MRRGIMLPLLPPRQVSSQRSQKEEMKLKWEKNRIEERGMMMSRQGDRWVSTVALITEVSTGGTSSNTPQLFCDAVARPAPLMSLTDHLVHK